MELNKKNFEDLIKKATFNFIIPTICITFFKGKTYSRMTTPDNNIVVVIEKPNEEVSPDDKSLELTFMDPVQNVKPFVSLFDEEFLTLKTTSSKVTLSTGSQKTTIQQCDPQFVTTFTADITEGLDYIFTLDINDEVFTNLQKISKIGSRFENLYVTVEDKKLYVETTDKTNSHSNGVSVLLGDIDFDNFEVKFGVKNYTALINLIKNSLLDYQLKVVYSKEHEMGMLVVESTNGYEKYFMLPLIQD